MTRRLVPKPHMLKSVRSRNWTLSGAVEELVDNSIGHGKATEITVIIANTMGIAVEDNGSGVDDINRIFTFGDASAYEDLHQIGQFGVGATNATIYLGDQTEVTTVHNRTKHSMKVDWGKVERSGEWPEAYEGRGRLTFEPSGTRVLVLKPARHYQFGSSEKMAKDFGQVFAPALRAGTKITIHHQLTGNYARNHPDQQTFEVEPFTLADLTDVIEISGEVARPGEIPLRWKGRAGLSASLVERYNGVHISFGHRVIEVTRDPFQGRSAPTLYVEVQLDDWTPWKHQLSEHKDRVVRYREELVESIYETIKQLLERSEQQAQSLALDAMTAPIEAAITRVMRGAGMLHFDPEAEPRPGPSPGPGPAPGPGDGELFDPADDGETGREAPQATGVSIEWSEAGALEGRAWTWRLSGRAMVVILDKQMFGHVVGWPTLQRDQYVIHMIVAFLSHALEIEHYFGVTPLRNVLAKPFAAQIVKWAEETRPSEISQIAPQVYRCLIDGARLPAQRRIGRGQRVT